MCRLLRDETLFDPPVKIRGGVGKISRSIIELEALPTTEPPEYI